MSRADSLIELDISPQPSGPAPFLFKSSSELVKNITPPDWLVKRFLERDCLALMFGDPGSGKSFAAIDIAYSVATGTPWHDVTTNKGPVFYIAGEGHNGLAKRIMAWQIDRQTPIDDVPLFFSERAASLYDEESARSVCEAVTTISRESGTEPALIVIDTLARNFGGANENATDDMNLFISHIDRFLRVPFKACVLIVHHTGHGEKGRARGSMALKGALDAEYKVSQDEGGIVRIECTKMKDAVEPPPMAFNLSEVELPLTDEDGEPVTSAVLKAIDWQPNETRSKPRLSARNEAILTSLQRAIQLHGIEPTPDIKNRFGGFGSGSSRKIVHDDLWRKEAYPIIDIDSGGDEAHAKRMAFRRGQEALRKKHTQTMNGYWWVIYD